MDQGSILAHHWQTVPLLLTRIWAEAQKLSSEPEPIRATCNAFAPDGSVHPTGTVFLTGESDGTEWHVQVGLDSGSEYLEATDWDTPVGFPDIAVPIDVLWLGRNRWNVRQTLQFSLPPIRVGERRVQWGAHNWDSLDSFDPTLLVDLVCRSVFSASQPQEVLEAAAELIERRAPLAAKDEGLEGPFDLGLSYAGEQRAFVDEVAHALRSSGLSVFYDAFLDEALLGRNLIDRLHDIFTNRCRYVVMFISEQYVQKDWPTLERRAAQAKAFESRTDYLLPIRFDDTPVPGLPSTVAYLDARVASPSQIATKLCHKLQGPSSGSGSPNG